MNTQNKDSNPDPITKAPGSHPIGTGLGAAGAGTAGAAIGAIAGPVGALAGAAIGAVVGGLAGKGVAEVVDPTVEDAYWRENYVDEDYVAENDTYDDFGPAYRLGYEGYVQGEDYETAETRLKQSWESQRGASGLPWEKAKRATRAGWERVATGRHTDAGRGL